MLNLGAVGKPEITQLGRKTMRRVMANIHSLILHQYSFAPNNYQFSGHPRKHRYFHIDFTKPKQYSMEWQAHHSTPATIFAYRWSHRPSTGQ